MGNLVAIVGRPNVGKSTLFNRLTKTRQAIVNDEAGTTRDRQYGKSEWLGREFSVVDTGGWVVNSDDIFEEEIRKQVLMAVDEADVILFVVDVMNGVTDLDLQVASILRRTKKPVLLVANKTDNNELQYNAPEFYSLGLGDPYCISAVTGSGTGDLMDLIVENFKKESDEILDEDIPRFAVVGRPNAGKSSIVNAFIGEDRNIVTEIAGTTRDSIYTRYNKFGFDFYLVDTAGIRKKNKVNEDLEYYSVIRSIRSIENSDVCILMLDATRGIESQDLNIFSLIQKNSKGLVVVVNKWDLVEDKTVKVMKTFENAIRNRFAPFVDFPIIFASALTKQRILKVLEEARTVYENRMIRIPTARLNEEMLPLIEAYPPPAIKGKYIKIKYITQLPNTQIPSSFSDSITSTLYMKHPRTLRMKADMVDKMDYDKILSMYQDRFKDASDFTFILVGNVDVEAVKPLIESYLGALPSINRKETFKDNHIEMRKGIYKNEFIRQQETPKVNNFISYSGTCAYTLRNDILMSMTDQLLNLIYTEKVREDEGGTYGVYPMGQLVKYPTERAVLQIFFNTAPDKQDKLMKIIYAEAEAFAKNGPDEASLNKVKEYMLKKHNENLKENGYWLNSIDEYLYTGINPIKDYEQIVNGITAKDIQKFANELLKQKNQITVSMISPEKK